MIEIKSEKISPLSENRVQRYKELYQLQSDLKKKSECTSVSVDVQFFDDDDQKIRSILVNGQDQNGDTVSYFKNYYRNGQLSEAGRIRNGKFEEQVSFREDGTPDVLAGVIMNKMQKGM